MAWRKVWKGRRKGVRKDAWLIRWYDDAGNMKSKTVHATADEAEEECRRMEQDLNDGTLGRRKKGHWLDFCQELLADLASHKRPRTVEDYKETLEALTAEYRPVTVDSIHPGMLKKFVRQKTAGRANATRNKLIRTLRAIFSRAVPEYLSENPAKKVEFADDPEKDERTLSPEELLKVLDVADSCGQAVIMFGACSGLRREEIAALRWKDVELENGKVHVKNSEWHTTKSGRQRSVLVPPALIDLLKAMHKRSKSQFIFPEVYLSYRELPNDVRKEWSERYRKAKADGVTRQEARQLAWRHVHGCQQPERPIDPDRLTDLIPRIVKHAGLPHCTLHDLRRTFCTYLAACGTDLLAAQRLAGHSSPTVTAKSYVRLVPATLKAQEQLPFWNLKPNSGPDQDEDAAA